MSFARAQKIADAVLYEGYALYPYRATSQKNRIRFQWGVLVPPAFAAIDPSERFWSQTQCLVERADRMALRLRFLTLRARPAGPDRSSPPWDDATEQQIDIEVDLRGAGPTEHRIERDEVLAEVLVTVEALHGPYQLGRLTIRVENQTAPGSISSRDEALRHSLVGCHLLLHLEAERARFISLIDPPEWARGYVDECENVGTFPVLAGDAGDDRLLLSSPIILYDHPVVAPESPGDLFDATEIDEILTLRTMALTHEEKREAQATDPRVAALIDNVDFLPPEMLVRLHGAIRSVQPMTAPALDDEPWLKPDSPWWDPAADESVSPTTDTVVVAGQVVGRGSRVRLRPVLRGGDAQDMFLAGREANVEAVLHDVDGNRHLAVSLVDDPGADLVAFHGRYLYFSPDEIEPVPT